MIPPLNSSTSCCFEKVVIVFATTTGSPLIRVSAIGPVRSSSSSVPALAAASFARRFLTILKVASDSRSFERSSAACGTLIPLYSTAKIACDSERRSASSSTTAVFSSLFKTHPNK